MFLQLQVFVIEVGDHKNTDNPSANSGWGWGDLLLFTLHKLVSLLTFNVFQCFRTIVKIRV